MTNGFLHKDRQKWLPLGIVVLVAFLLRVFRLGQQPLSWDEGWSIGLSSLGPSLINRITALDVHPPLYYYLLKTWQQVARTEWLLRLSSAMAGLLVVPLMYVTGKSWARLSSRGADSTAVGVYSAAVAAVSPFLIYYSQVTRMFALCAMLVVLTTFFLLEAVRVKCRRLYLGFVLSAVAAFHTFYYSAMAVAAVALYVLLVRPRQWKRILLAGVSTALLCVPWLSYAVPPMLSRVGSRTGFAFAAADLFQFLTEGIYGLVFAYGAGWGAVGVVAGLITLAVLVSKDKGATTRMLLLPIIAITLVLAAVSVGAKAHMFAARYLIPASPFLCLALGWSLAICWKRSPKLGLVAVLLMLVSVGPTISTYVYAKTYEVSGAFDPTSDYRFLQGKTTPEDIVFFNILSLAGQYEHLRTRNDPPWSFVQRWDPVVEPLQPALEERVLPASLRHERLWFVLYKGTVAANLELKEWLDHNLYPTFGQWGGDTLYLLYLSPRGDSRELVSEVTFAGGLRLEKAQYTKRADRGGGLGVSLSWSTTAKIDRNYKVFVHLYSPDGRLAAQHDAIPVNELRPMPSWLPGEQVVDRHGLWVPTDVQGPLRLVVGIYDPETGTRLLLENGEDTVTLGLID